MSSYYFSCNLEECNQDERAAVTAELYDVGYSVDGGRYSYPPGSMWQLSKKYPSAVFEVEGLFMSDVHMTMVVSNGQCELVQ